DILIGGTGSDVINGKGSGDIMIGGSTAYDGNLAALRFIRAEWKSSHGYETRIANLSGTGTTGLNGPAGAQATGPGAPVFADNSRDELYGGSGNDWFFLDTGSNFDRSHGMSSLESHFAVYVG